VAICLAVYWVAMFAATHVPRIPAALQMPGSDKWQHLAAYAGLSFLLSAWKSLDQPLSWGRALRILGIVAGYGAFDELSQIPVGRDAELLDWFADVIGGAGGIAAHAAMTALVRRLRAS
jgi:VanZ family protein